jgi:cystathionine beta-lyase/cystathionine gamma-synthase
MEKQCSNAERLATKLQALPEISEVIYPKLFEGEDATALDRTFHGSEFGAIVTIRLAEDSREASYRFLNALKLCTRAASVGDLFTGIVHPATATHRELSPAKRAAIGITEGLIRISVGIEDLNDIFADIEQALAFCPSPCVSKGETLNSDVSPSLTVGLVHSDAAIGAVA